MPSIIAQNLPRELSDETSAELVVRLKRGAAVSKDIDAGKTAVSMSPMAKLANDIGKAEGPYRPSEDEQGILFVVLDTWLLDVSKPAFPEDAMTLRYALFCDIDDRRPRHDAAASS